MSLKSLQKQYKTAKKKERAANKAAFAAKRNVHKLWRKIDSLKNIERKKKKAKLEAARLKAELLKNKKDVMPLRGALTVYKKVYDIPSGNAVIATLLIPAKAKRNQNLKDHQGWKCRASEAKVLDLTHRGKKIKKARSGHSTVNTTTGARTCTIYEVGKTVKPKQWSKDKETCAGGIHFFMQRSRAIAY